MGSKVSVDGANETASDNMSLSEDSDMVNGSNSSGGHVWLYGGEAFQRFSMLYESIHLPLSLVICLLGVAANTSNVIVLTRRSMITPTNIVLTGLSAAQLFLLINYLLLLTFNVSAANCLFPGKPTNFFSCIAVSKSTRKRKLTFLSMRH